MIIRIFSDEIAYCMEKSYRQVSFKEAARMLYLNNQNELAEIAKKVNKNFFPFLDCLIFFQHGWKLESDQTFHFADNQSKLENEHVPADEIASQMIQYAREMEIII